MKRLLILISVMALAFSGVAVGATKGKKTSGIAYAGVTHAEGNDLYVSGDIKDKILGRGAIVYITNVTQGEEKGTFNVEAKKITIYTPKGTLTGKGSGVQTIHEDGSTDVSDGKFNLTKGTGKLKGHTLKGTFSGPQEQGVYKFSYSGVYK
jgi:hypothetical protein